MVLVTLTVGCVGKAPPHSPSSPPLNDRPSILIEPADKSHRKPVIRKGDVIFRKFDAVDDELRKLSR